MRNFGGALPRHKLVALVSLHIKQRAEVAVVDAGRSRGGHRRLGVIGNAEAGIAQHIEIVGAVTDRNCFFVP